MSKQTQTKPLSTAARVGLSAVGALALLLGLYFAVGGALLVVRGGTWYYLLMGLAVCATGIQFARRRSSAYVIFLIAVVATALWAVWRHRGAIRRILRGQKNVDVMLADATAIDLAGREVILADGSLAFDLLIIATVPPTRISASMSGNGSPPD